MDNSFDFLFKELDKRLENGNVILAIDGASSSGKTTLAASLLSKYDCTVFHMDDFFLTLEKRSLKRLNEVGGNIDYERFMEEIIVHLMDENITYHKYDCSDMKFLVEEVNLKKLVVIEGVYSLHDYFGKYYDLAVFLDISSNLQKERILKRNPFLVNRFLNEWIPLENEYFDKMNIKDKVDFVISCD